MKKNLFHLLFIPSKKNKFRPFLLGRGALTFYIILASISFLLFSPFYTIRFSTWLADLSQDLVISEVNPDRQIAGLSLLKTNDKLTEAAQLKAEDMIVRDYFSHVGPDGESPWVWFEQVGYDYATAGENLAIDFYDPSTLEKAWLASPAHRENIMNEYFTDIGIGVANGEINGNNTIVVVMFLGREITPTLQKILKGEIIPKGIIDPKSEKKEDTLVVTPREVLAAMSPQEPVVTKTVEEENLDKENLVTLETLGKENNLIDSSAVVGHSKLFILGEGPKTVRIILTVFFSFLLILVSIAVILKKLKYPFAASRIFTFVSLLLLLWLPEIIL
ncbi:MAG: CAP domain-containing protein [Candidatus Heimdallarchaeaceae archaeon]